MPSERLTVTEVTDSEPSSSVPPAREPVNPASAIEKSRFKRTVSVPLVLSSTEGTEVCVASAASSRIASTTRVTGAAVKLSVMESSLLSSTFAVIWTSAKSTSVSWGGVSVRVE